MKRNYFFRNRNGTSLLELVFGILITSILVIGVFRAWRYFDSTTTREKYKAELQRDVITVTNIIERDIRMAGYGLPGNGIYVNLDASDNDKITFYTNENNSSTGLAQDAQPAHTKIYVNDASFFSVGGTVCLAGTDTIYRTIQHVGINASGDDTLILTASINTAQPLWAASSNAYPAMSISYEISGSAPFSLRRSRNGADLNIGGKLDSIEVKPKDISGNVLAGNGTNASVITIVMGGYVGKDGNRVFLAESTEVNIRNNY